MTAPDNGGPAFPIETTATPWAEGMTLRDWFAGQALATAYVQNEADAHKTAVWAYNVADAMLDARR